MLTKVRSLSVHLLCPKAEAAKLVQNLIGRLRPRERRVLVVVDGHVVQDRFTQLRNARVRPALEGFLGEQPEEAFNQVQPGRVGRREVEVDPRMTDQPPLDGWRFVRGQIVESVPWRR